MTSVRQISSGKSQFPVIGTTSSGYHTPEMKSQEARLHAEKTINIDDLLISSAF